MLFRVVYNCKGSVRYDETSLQTWEYEQYLYTIQQLAPSPPVLKQMSARIQNVQRTHNAHHFMNGS